MRQDLRDTVVRASSLAAKVYALKVVGENVGDSDGNATRFHILDTTPAVPTGKDRTALMFKLSNTPRALLLALTAISVQGVNISSIHSIPLGNAGEYAFYLEFDIHQDTEMGREVLHELKKVSYELVILGSYPQASE